MDNIPSYFLKFKIPDHDGHAYEAQMRNLQISQNVSLVNWTDRPFQILLCLKIIIDFSPNDRDLLYLTCIVGS